MDRFFIGQRLVLLVAVLWALEGAHASPLQLLSNLEQPQSGTTPRGYLQYGQGFVTGPDPAVLGSVRIASAGFSNIRFGIYTSRAASDSWWNGPPLVGWPGGPSIFESPTPSNPTAFGDPFVIGPGFTPQTFNAPGTLITALSGPLAVEVGQVGAYVPESVVTLQPNTRYFVAATGNSGPINPVRALRITADGAASPSTGFSFDPYYTTQGAVLAIIRPGWNPTGESTESGNIQLELNKASVTTHRGVFSGGLIPAGELVAIEAGATVTGDIINNGILRFPSSSSTQVVTSISGAGVLVVDGGGAVTLTGQNTHLGMTTIANGTLRIGSGGTSGSITSPITNNGSLVFDRSDNLAYGGRISGTGAVTKSGSGTLALTGQNDLRGGTVISEGVLALQSWGALGTTGDILMTGGTLQFSANNREDHSQRFKSTAGQNFNIDTNGQSVSFASTIAGANNGFKKYGEGTLTLAAANTYTGVTSIQQGTLAVTNSAAVSSSPLVSLAGVASLDVSGLSSGYTVPSGQTIGGSGTILGSVTFGAGSTLSPGLSSGVSVAALLPSADQFFTPQTIAVPEPATLGLLGVGLGFLSLGGLRRKQLA